MKKHICFLLIVFTVASLPSFEIVKAGVPHIQWENTFGGSENDVGLSLAQTSDGGYVISGYTGTYDESGYVVKTDFNGNYMWRNEVGDFGQDRLYSIKQVDETSYIAAGLYQTTAGRFYIINQYSSSGSGWYGDALFTDVQLTNDGGGIITGRSVNQVVLVKINSNFEHQWMKRYSTGMGFSVQQTNDSGYVVTGRAYKDSQYYVCLMKTDSEGNLLWERTYGGSDYDCGTSVKLTSDGGYIVTGYKNSFGAGGCDVYLIKTDSEGNPQWQKTYGGTGSDVGNCIQITSDGGYIIAGYTDSFGNGGPDIYLVRTDSEGYLQWQKTYGGASALSSVK